MSEGKVLILLPLAFSGSQVVRQMKKPKVLFSKNGRQVKITSNCQ